jgi:transposase
MNAHKNARTTPFGRAVMVRRVLEDGWTVAAAAAASRLRPEQPARKSHLVAGSDGGARYWTILASLVATAKLNGVEPLAWLADVLERMVSGRTKAHELKRLLPWAWKAKRLAVASDI